MHSIGERLEEARKRKGISLREAAEATKIRSDYLADIEQNKFDFELPDIYKRGFLKNYARYLKLDPEKIITDYSAVQLGNSRTVKRGGTELFGKMDSKNPSHPPAEAPENSYGRISPSTKPKQAELDEEDDFEDEGGETDKMLYMKVGLVGAGTLALVFVVFGLVKAILSSGSDTPIDTPELRSSTETVQQNTVGSGNTRAPSTPAAASDSITLTASGALYVLVQQQSDKQTIYNGTLSSGETVTLEKQGPVSILFDDGKNLTIEQNGELFRPSAEGPARITIQ